MEYTEEEVYYSDFEENEELGAEIDIDLSAEAMLIADIEYIEGMNELVGMYA